MTLYGPDGTVLAADVITDTITSFGAMAEQNGTYVLEVEPHTPPEFTGRGFGFQVDTANPNHITPFDNVSNDNRASALPIDDVPANLTGILAAQEADWYAVELGEGDRLNVSLQYLHGSPRVLSGNVLTVQIFDADGNPVGELDDWRGITEPGDPITAMQTFLAEEPGTYYVRVDGRDLGGFTAYELSVDVPRTIVTETVPLRASVNRTVDDNEVHRLTFNAENGEVIRIVHVGYPDGVQLTLYGPGGDVLAKDRTSAQRLSFGRSPRPTGRTRSSCRVRMPAVATSSSASRLPSPIGPVHGRTLRTTTWRRHCRFRPVRTSLPCSPRTRTTGTRSI
ncbi:hypothetical protein BRC81_00115 [Halobacteriales archaeon QS_1_68_20]|nr:MAG: hypothetical protein BRC81_00115 [Halobacteriales archaeon QS_1_68_20]